MTVRQSKITIFMFQLSLGASLLGAPTDNTYSNLLSKTVTKRSLSSTGMVILENSLEDNFKVDESDEGALEERNLKKRQISDLNYGDYSNFFGDAEEESYANDYEGFLSSSNKRHGGASGPKIWDHWGKWSHCTVTCGIGKITRWRHCVSGGCASGEKEAQIKTCTLAAC